MQVKYQSFGTYNGVEFEEVYVTNRHNVTVAFSDLGARINRWLVPTADGQVENIILGHPDAQEAASSGAYYGATVGRVAGRIAKGKFELNGVTYSLPINNGDNHLHGGLGAMDVAKWDCSVEVFDTYANVIYTYEDPAGANGYPGNLRVKVTHTFNDDNEWTVAYEATTDEDTLFNPTNHVYFNLNGDNKLAVHNHQLQVAANYYLPLSEHTVPTGEKALVEGTPFDLRKPTFFAEVADSTHPQFVFARGFDHPFVLESQMTPHAIITCPATKRTIKMTTQSPTVVIYTHNYLSQPETVWGNPVLKHAGITLETQVAPDAVHHEQFGSIVLKKDDTYTTETTYKLELE